MNHITSLAIVAEVICFALNRRAISFVSYCTAELIDLIVLLSFFYLQMRVAVSIRMRTSRHGLSD